MPLVLDPIQSGYNLSKINDNFEKIQDTWDEKLDRVNSGSFYNQMDQTLDMNSNEIINVKVGDSDDSLVNKGYVDTQDNKRVLKAGDSMTGQLNTIDPVQPSNAANKGYVDVLVNAIDGVEGIVPQLAPRYKGDGVTTVFPTNATQQFPAQSFRIEIDGVTQRPIIDYNALSNGSIEFVDAPEVNTDIDITLYQPVDISEAADASQVTATGSTTPRTLADRFADVVNVKDFGAVGDGVTDDTQAIEDAYAIAIERGADLLFDGVFRVTRPLILNANIPGGGFNQNTHLVGTGKWQSGILYDGATDETVMWLSNSASTSRVNGFGITDMYIDCNDLAATSIKHTSVVDPWFSDFTFERSAFLNATESCLRLQCYVGTIRKNHFLGNADVGLWIQAPLTTGGNTSTLIEGNWATEGVKKGYKVENLVYSSFRNNACDGQSVELAYELTDFNGTFEANGAEQTQKYASFDKCVVDIVSPFPGFIGLDGGNVDNIIEIKGRTKSTFANFQEPDQWLKPGNTATNLIYIDPANQDGCDITVLDGTVRPEHVYVEYANLSSSARNPRCITFPFLRDTFAHYGGGFATGGEVSAEFTGVDFQRFGRPYNPVSRNSMSFYTSAVSTLKTLSNFNVTASDAGQQAAMYVVKVTGTRRYVNVGEVFSYQFNVTYANNIKSTSNTALIPCTAGVPCSIDINASGNLELETKVADTLWQVEITAVSALGKMSSSATIGMTNPFIIDVQ
ncbi:hypothetical protein VP177E371_P0081 [Vibrio phage 177E37-1]|nr:hypothetical protein VP177E371_P0081 [Vibrio phage 177E37-1]